MLRSMETDIRLKLDRYDRAIVRALQLDGRITNSQLADSVSLSESACLRRVRALEEAGFIEGYSALINQQKGGLSGQRVRDHHLGTPRAGAPAMPSRRRHDGYRR